MNPHVHVSLLALFASLTVAHADVKLPSVFSDHMVLQADCNVPVFGSAEPGEQVTVEFNGQKKTANTGKDGKWLVRLDPTQGERALRDEDHGQEHAGRSRTFSSARSGLRRAIQHALPARERDRRQGRCRERQLSEPSFSARGRQMADVQSEDGSPRSRPSRFTLPSRSPGSARSPSASWTTPSAARLGRTS